MKPKDCVNSNCKNIVYVPDHSIHLSLMCEKCIEAKSKKSSFDQSLEWWAKLSRDKKNSLARKYDTDIMGSQLISQDIHRIFKEEGLHL